MKQQVQSDELSKAIDALNQRQPYTTADGELKQLLYTASFVKQYGRSTAETAIISRLADQISSDCIARRRRKRLLSALAGAAAAALLFAGISFHTPAEVAQEQSTEIARSPQVAIAEKVNVVAPDVTNKSIEPLPANLNQPAAATTSNVQAEELPGRVKDLSTPEIKDDPQPKDRPLVVADAQKSGAAVLMILPNRSADAVLSEAGGTVRQVYGKNTDKEIIVTQRSQTTSKEKTSVEPGLTAAPAAKQARVTVAPLNKATRNVNGLEVEVEGKQPQAELEKMADSLVPASQPDGTSLKKE